ncbi:MAG TPA: hypothetical protein VH297_07465 [Gaiellaceae bacterium]
MARWLEANGHGEPGVILTADELCDLAYAWWSDRLDPDWRPHTREQNQAILDGLGLTGEFWRLA